MSIKISVIIPVKNEIKHGLLDSIRSTYKNKIDVELIWVAGPSSDGTVKFLKRMNQKVIESKINSRAGRINEGIKAALSDFILVNHPRSVLAEEAIDSLLNHFAEMPLSWGGFTHKFLDSNHWLLKFTSFYSNYVRFDKRGIIYLDHCIFFNKKMLKNINEAFPNVDIFEDTLFSKQLLSCGRPKRLAQFSKTSAVRFNSNGVFMQSYLNQKLKWQYYFGKSLTQMNKTYEEGLDLNSSYK